MTDRIGPYELDSIVTGDAVDLITRLPDGSVDFVLWDPDYGVGMDYGDGKTTSAQAVEFVSAIMPDLMRVNRSGQLVMFWSGSWARIADLNDALRDKWHIHYMGIWYKPNGAGPSGNGLARRFETWFWIKQAPKPRAEWTALPDVLEENRITIKSKEGVEHPSQKPVMLLRRLIKFFTLPGQIVLDPTIGSGSTAVAASLEQRHFLGFERNAEYVAMGYNRLVDLRLPMFQSAMELYK